MNEIRVSTSVMGYELPDGTSEVGLAKINGGLAVGSDAYSGTDDYPQIDRLAQIHRPVSVARQRT
jgi:hypothetical protein